MKYNDFQNNFTGRIFGNGTEVYDDPKLGISEHVISEAFDYDYYVIGNLANHRKRLISAIYPLATVQSIQTPPLYQIFASSLF